MDQPHVQTQNPKIYTTQNSKQLMKFFQLSHIEAQPIQNKTKITDLHPIFPNKT
jgi:hypothetical protein